MIDLKNAFDNIHRHLIGEVLRYHHTPDHIQQLILNINTDFKTSISRDYTTPFLPVRRGVLQADCLSPLLFNIYFTFIFNTSIQYIKAEKFRQMGYYNSNDSGLSFRPVHWLQLLLYYYFSTDAAIITGNERENQLLLNCFTIWCQWAGMKIRVDKCVTFGMKKGSTKSEKIQRKLLINSELVPPAKPEE